MATSTATNGGLSFGATARTGVELKSIGGTTGKLARHDLKVNHPAQYEKLKTSLTQGSKNKFSIVKAIVEKDGRIEIGNVVRTEQLKKTLRKHIQSNGMADLFKMYDSFDATTGLPDPNGATFDILESPHLLALVDIAKVKQNIRTYNLYAPDHVIEDSNLVAEYVKNCCNDTLKAKIDEKILKYTKSERGGVVFYFILF